MSGYKVITHEKEGKFYWMAVHPGELPMIAGVVERLFPTDAEARAQGEAVVAALTGAVRKPIQWHPPTEKPESGRLIVVVNGVGDNINTEHKERLYSLDKAWCYADALAADALAAMEGEG